MLIPSLLALFALLHSPLQQTNAPEQRQRLLVNKGWEYLERDIDDRRAALKSEGWVKVDLPHSWNVWDAVDPIPGYRRAASWYKKQLQIPDFWKGRRLILSFEGVNIVCEVYVNGKRAGGHVGGYVGFSIDMTPYVVFGGENEIVVWVHNRIDRNVIPSQTSDFCIYGGITRDVWLDVVSSTRIRQVMIRTPNVSAQSAKIEITAVMEKSEEDSESLEINGILVDPAGREAARISVSRAPVFGESKVILLFSSLKNPRLWSPEDPALYTAHISIKRKGEVLDKISERFGLRWFEFKERGPFLLNGRRLLLRGTHRHEDYAGFANAMPDSVHRRDLRMIKEMGANFVRLAHYPQDPEVYRACDELGLLVWDELPWCRGGMGGEEWKSNTVRLLKEQIERYYNHPSIIIRSLGNEMNWLPEFPGGDHLDSLRGMIRELNRIAHELDPERVTATRKFTEGADLVDIVSPSMWPGWYSGSYKGYEKGLVDARENLPRFFHAEYGGDSHVGRHVENPITGDAMTGSEGWEEEIKPQKVKNVSQLGDWSESYIVDLFDWMLSVSESLDWFSGSAQWAFKDFPTPLRPENPIPYMNQKGLVDRSGKPKDAYYVFKSYWSSSPLFCYIESHSWKERSGRPGVKRELNVYSNCEEVELVLNGKSQGKKRRIKGAFPAQGLSWMVEFQQGRNVLIAAGFHGGKRMIGDSVAVEYSFTRNEAADHIELSSEVLENGNRLITAVAVDKNGRRCLDYNKRIYFSSEGQGRLLVNYGTPTRSSIIEMANGAASIEFEPNAGGRAIVEARNQDFKGAYITIAP